MSDSVLSNGVLIPQSAFGTWKLSAALTVSTIEDAISCGYRMIDTAAIMI